jgi:hypothetical protein
LRDFIEFTLAGSLKFELAFALVHWMKWLVAAFPILLARGFFGNVRTSQIIEALTGARCVARDQLLLMRVRMPMACYDRRSLNLRPDVPESEHLDGESDGRMLTARAAAS